jgi:hypothetical protein
MLHELAGLQGKQPTATSTTKSWQDHVARYEGRSPKEKAEADELQHQVDQKLADSHHAHLRASRFDFAELGIEFALVLCSIALLTKQKGFWYVGLVSCLGGMMVALTGLFDLFMATGH